MKKALYLLFDSDKEPHGLIVADPDIKLPNGNTKVIKILLGDYADVVFNELIKD